jgi:3',5'-cyclic-AMP phosphodiesterase
LDSNLKQKAENMTDTLVTFVHISDTHIHADPNFTGEIASFSSRPGVAALIQEINRLPFPIDFVLHTGDVMTDPEHHEDYLIARDILSEIRCPVYYLPGNHDRPAGMRQFLMPDLITSVEGQMYYEFDFNGVQFIALDSHLSGSGGGLLADQQLSWLEALLARPDHRPLVVALHHHPLLLGAPWLDTIPLQNGEILHRILLPVRNRLRGVFYGHIHETSSTIRDGISYISALSAWFQTRTWQGQTEPFQDPVQIPGFHVVTLTPQDTFVRAYRVPFSPVQF